MDLLLLHHRYRSQGQTPEPDVTSEPAAALGRAEQREVVREVPEPGQLVLGALELLLAESELEAARRGGEAAGEDDDPWANWSKDLDAMLDNVTLHKIQVGG